MQTYLWQIGTERIIGTRIILVNSHQNHLATNVIIWFWACIKYIKYKNPTNADNVTRSDWLYYVKL